MTTTQWILIVLYSLAWIGIAQETHGNPDCRTVWGSPGHCVNIRKCDPLFALLKERSPHSSVFNLLRQAQCGFEGFDPKVCCSMPLKRPVHTSASKHDFGTVMNKISMTTATYTRTTRTTTPPTPSPPPPSPESMFVEDHPNRRLVNDDTCGPIMETRIFGGNETSLNEFPWMALLGYDVGKGLIKFRCGGSIINKNYILSAAHCVTSLKRKYKLHTIRLGDYDLTTDRDCDDVTHGVGFNCASKYQEFGIKRVHIHPHYSENSLLNDVALVRLNGEADLTPPSVRPICLPLGSAALLMATSVIVTGWGTKETGVKSAKLRKVTLPIMTIDKCRAIFKRRYVIWHKHICAGGSYLEDSCAGDSGGPLQATAYYDGKPHIVQYGLVSYGLANCGSRGFPGVYTSIPHYMKWILDNITP